MPRGFICCICCSAMQRENIYERIKGASMRNLLLTIAYNGAGYHGWQVQENAHSVQAAFQEALHTVLAQPVDIKACSRTDTGVHARQFCISCKTASQIPVQRMPLALNRHLPPDIGVLDCREVPMDFHARYSCKGKEYQYEIWNTRLRDPFLSGRVLHYWQRLEEDLLDRAARQFIGTYDFTSFCTLDSREMGDMCRTVFDAGVTRSGNRVVFTVSANGFLYNMVRIMVGTLLRVQQGKYRVEDIAEIIAAKSRKRAGPTAPACGLYLNRVFYEDSCLGRRL